MALIKRKRDFLITEAQRGKIIRELITFYSVEKDEEIGIITAEELLDFFLENV
jgi:uncharacterized protein (DUF2164 family)